jgi:hypothetical protein
MAPRYVCPVLVIFYKIVIFFITVIFNQVFLDIIESKASDIVTEIALVIAVKVFKMRGIMFLQIILCFERVSTIWNFTWKPRF